VRGYCEHPSWHSPRQYVGAEKVGGRLRCEFCSIGVKGISTELIILTPNVRNRSHNGIGEDYGSAVNMARSAAIFRLRHVWCKLMDIVLPRREFPKVVTIQNVVGAILAPCPDLSAGQLTPAPSPVRWQQYRTCA